MAVGTLVSVDEYLRTAYEPDCDYIDGNLVERNLGERSHGRLQVKVVVWLCSHEGVWQAKTLCEVRLRINQRRFRIPDVMVLSASAPLEEVVATPPLLCIEILSPGDSLNQIWERTQDYFAIGVPNCWILDPLACRAWTATPAALTEAKDGILRAGEIEMALAEVLD